MPRLIDPTRSLGKEGHWKHDKGEEVRSCLFACFLFIYMLLFSFRFFFNERNGSVGVRRKGEEVGRESSLSYLNHQYD